MKGKTMSDRKRINRLDELSKQKNQKVFVYRNLSYRDGVVWSAKSVALKVVVGHLPDVLIENPVFKVSKAGQARVRREQKKYVHAGVQGHLSDPDGWMIRMDSLVRVTYNPYKNDTFVRCDTGEPIYSARLAVIDASGVRVLL